MSVIYIYMYCIPCGFWSTVSAVKSLLCDQDTYNALLVESVAADMRTVSLNILGRSRFLS